MIAYLNQKSNLKIKPIRNREYLTDNKCQNIPDPIPTEQELDNTLKHTHSNMTLRTYSDTERNTTNTRDGVSREGSVSPKGMCEAMHGADAFCSPPTVVAERTLPAAGLSPSGWPTRESYRQAFPSGGPAGRTRLNGLFSTFKCVRTRCGAKSIRGP